jgi:hypothetical protein
MRADLTGLLYNTPIGKRGESWHMRVSSLARLAMLAGLWGSSFLWIAVALRSLSPAQIALVRLAPGAALLLLVVVVRRNRKLPTGAKIWAHLAIAAPLANAIPYTLFGISEQHIASSMAGAQISHDGALLGACSGRVVRACRRPALPASSLAVPEAPVLATGRCHNARLHAGRSGRRGRTVRRRRDLCSGGKALVGSPMVASVPCPRAASPTCPSRPRSSRAPWGAGRRRPRRDPAVTACRLAGSGSGGS